MKKKSQYKNAVIIHGRCDSREKWLSNPNAQSNSHWIPWLQWELLKLGVDAHTPEMPSPFMPDIDYDEWAAAFSRFDVNEATLLVGHSNGAGFILKYLSLNPDVAVGRIVLVAPWLDLEGTHPTFHRGYEMTPALLSRVRDGMDLFASTDDDMMIKNSAAKILDVYGDAVRYREFANYGHFCESDMGTREFPELLAVIKD